MLVKQAYPNCSQTTTDELGYDAFLLGLKDPNIATLVWSVSGPNRTLITAYESARDHLAFKQSQGRISAHPQMPTNTDIRATDFRETTIEDTNISRTDYSKINPNKQVEHNRRDLSRDRNLRYEDANQRHENKNNFVTEERFGRLENMFQEMMTSDRQRNMRSRNNSANSYSSSEYGRNRNNFKPRYGRGQCFDCGSRDHYRGSKNCRAYVSHHSGSPGSARTYDSSRYNRRNYEERNKLRRDNQDNQRSNDRDIRRDRNYDSDDNQNNYGRNDRDFRRDNRRSYDDRSNYGREDRSDYRRSDNPNWRDKDNNNQWDRRDNNRPNFRDNRQNRIRTLSMDSREHDFSDEDFLG